MIAGAGAGAVLPGAREPYYHRVMVRVTLVVLGFAAIASAAPYARQASSAPAEPGAPGVPAVPAAPLEPQAPRAPEAFEPPSFEAFLAGIRAEAIERGLSPAAVDSALAGLSLQPVVVARDRAQLEQVQSLDAYLAQRLTARTVTTARQMHRRHAGVLRGVEREFGVPAAVMTAIWGLESNFGRFTGTYPTIRALATLAYDGRRALFRSELLAALEMVD